MAISINRNGLIFYVDADIRESYPGSGNTWYDLSGQGNHGTIYGTPQFDNSNSGSLFFNRADPDYVETIANASIGTGPVTLAAWVKGTTETINKEIGIISFYRSPSYPWHFVLERSSWIPGSPVLYVGYQILADPRFISSRNTSKL